MRFELTVSGGVAHFPGLSKPSLVDSEALPAEEAAELERLAADARLFELTPPPATVRPDARRYKLKVEEGGRVLVLELSDPVSDPALAALLRLLRQKARAR